MSRRQTGSCSKRTRRTMNNNSPDTHALNIAAAVQRQLPEDSVILYGSRARGEHRPDSDVDLLIITSSGTQSVSSAGNAAGDYMKRNPPWLEVNIVTMEMDEFQRNRRAKQHVAGQADHHGVKMSSEKLDHGADYDNEYPEHWPATRERLENSAEWSKEFNDMVNEDHWNQKLLGLSAQQSVENALRGLLSAYNDPTIFRHDLNRIWDHYLLNHHDAGDPSAVPLLEAVSELLAHTTYPSDQSPEGYRNWLTQYAADYRYHGSSKQMDRDEKLVLQELVNQANNHLTERIHVLSGTSDDDLFPDGVPWL